MNLVQVFVLDNVRDIGHTNPIAYKRFMSLHYMHLIAQQIEWKLANQDTKLKHSTHICFYPHA